MSRPGAAPAVSPPFPEIETYDHFGRWLQDVETSLGMSRTAFVEYLGVAYATVRARVALQDPPRASVRRVIARALAAHGMTVDRMERHFGPAAVRAHSPADPTTAATLGEWLRGVRQLTGLSMTALAAEVELSEYAWKTYETNQRKPRVLALRRLRDACGFPNETLTGVLTTFYGAVDARRDPSFAAAHAMQWAYIASPVGSRRERELRDRIVADHLGDARRAARRYSMSRRPGEDVEQTAAIALVGAVSRYVPRSEFSAYVARTCGMTVMKDVATEFLRGLPDEVVEIMRAARRVRAQAVSSGGPAPTDEEVAAALGVTTARLHEAQRWWDSRVRGDASLQGGEQDGRPYDVAGNEDGYEEVMVVDGVAPLLRDVPYGRELVLRHVMRHEPVESVAVGLGLDTATAAGYLADALDALRMGVSRDPSHGGLETALPRPSRPPSRARARPRSRVST